MPEHTTTPRAVFLSYAREDAEAVRRIADALRAFGVEVWFDQNELRGGDAWDQKIRSQIRTCTLCVPVISAATQARGEGYFRREWKIAVERTHDMAAGVPFLLPVVIDATAESDALVPEEFMRVQWTRLDHGVPTPQFVEHVRKLLENPGKPVGSGGHTRPAVAGLAEVGRPGSPTPATTKAVPRWSYGTIVAVVVAITTAVWVGRKPAPPPAATAAPSVEAAEAKPASIPLVVPKLSDKSIAVLPFTNMSEDKDSGFFADGVHEDILTNLALIRELRVVSRTSVMPYRTTAKSMRQIAQELGVTYILEGSVRRSGNKVRVTGQLIHAATDEHIWAQSYDRDLTDVFAIQAELSQQIAGALKTALSPEEKVMLARRPTENPAAYDKFLQAREIFNREGHIRAARDRRAELLQSAVALDSSFASAWGELGVVYAYAAFVGDAEMETQLAKAKEAIDRAVQLAPEDPDVITSLGSYYYYGYRDYDRATEQYNRFARQLPNSPRAYNALGLIQSRQGRWPESLANLRRATELDPANANYQQSLINSLVSARRWDEAIAAQRRLVALRSGDAQTRAAYNLAQLFHLATGSRGEAERFFASMTPVQRDSPLGIELQKFWAGVISDNSALIRLDKLQPYYDGYGQPRWEQAFGAATAYFAQGDKEGVRARLGDWPAELRFRVQREPGNFRQLVFLGGMEALLGRKQEALRAVDRAVELMPPSRDALDGAIYAYYRAIIYDYVGEKETALAEYTRLLSVPMSGGNMKVNALRTDTISSLRDDPRYKALLNDPKNNAPLF